MTTNETGLYDGARTLATIEHLGVKFQMVRRRTKARNKQGWSNWNKHTTLLYSGVEMTPHTMINGAAKEDPNHEPGSIEECARQWKAIFERTFKNREALRTAIAEFLQKRGVTP